LVRHKNSFCGAFLVVRHRTKLLPIRVFLLVIIAIVNFIIYKRS
jgi:hypothetical protein